MCGKKAKYILTELWIYPGGDVPAEDSVLSLGRVVYREYIEDFYKDLNKYGMTFILTSDQNMYKKYNDSILVRKRPGDFVVPKKRFNLNLDDNIIATSADSDGDYHR